jgi:hypothetical protein
MTDTGTPDMAAVGRGPTDRSDRATIEGRYSAWKLLKAIWAGVLLLAGCIWIVFGHFAHPGPNLILLMAAYSGLPWFSLLVLRNMYLLIKRTGQVAIAVTPNGIRDNRISQSQIPWQAVLNVRPYSFPKPSLWPFGKRQQIAAGMIVKLRPEFAKSFIIPSLLERMNQASSSWLCGGNLINGSGVDIDCDELLEISKSYVDRVAASC